MICNYTYTPQIWPPVLMAVLMITLSLYSGRRRSVPGATPLMITSLLAATWAAGSLLEYAAVDMPAKITWFKVQAVIQLPIITGITCFILEYTWPGRWLTRRNLALSSFPIILFIGMILTNDRYHLAWRGFSMQGTLRPEQGPGSWLMGIYFWVVLEALNLIVFGWLFLHSPQHRWPVVFMLVGQFAGRTLFLIDRFYIPNSVLPLDLLGMSFEFLVYAIVLFGFRILDPIPMARQTLVTQMREGMLVLDPLGRVTSLNPAAQAILGQPSRPLGKPIQDLLPAYRDEISGLQAAGTGLAEISLKTGPESRAYQVELSSLNDFRGQIVGRMLLLRDVTDQKHAQAQLLEQQRALATLQERERLARELHDGLGQALAAAHLQASTARLLLARGETDKISECLDNLADTTLQAEADMREYLLGVQTVISSDRPFFATLREYLVCFSRQYSLPVDLCVTPELEEQGMPQTIAVQLLRIIQEGLSNVRKHARAQCARITITVSGTLLRVVVSDDGQGFNLARVETMGSGGFGLQSMRERAEALGGRLEVISRDGQGTQVVVQVPVGERHGDTATR